MAGNIILFEHYYSGRESNSGHNGAALFLTAKVKEKKETFRHGLMYALSLNWQLLFIWTNNDFVVQVKISNVLVGNIKIICATKKRV